jgi:RND family efflux transporter MFP subunit
MKRIWKWLPLVALVAAGIGAWLWLDRPKPVPGARVTAGRALDLVYATGFVEPRLPVEVSSRVTAPVIEVLVAEGAQVVRGQPLVRLDAGEQQQAIAQLAAQTAQADLAERRALTLFEKGFVSAAGRDQAVATARSARAAERVARERLAQFEIRAGISGVVLRHDVEPGDLAAPSHTLMTLGDPAALRVTATVDERDIPRVRPGQAVLMSTDAFPGRVIRGRVEEVTPGGDPNQRAFRVRIAPDAIADLPIGLTLEVNIVTAEKPRALLAPARAVVDGKLWVAADGRARVRPVKVGIEGGEQVEIVSGIAAGTCVLAEPPPDLKDGARIAVSGC